MKKYKTIILLLNLKPIAINAMFPAKIKPTAVAKYNHSSEILKFHTRIIRLYLKECKSNYPIPSQEEIKRILANLKPENRKKILLELNERLPKQSHIPQYLIEDECQSGIKMIAKHLTENIQDLPEMHFEDFYTHKILTLTLKDDLEGNPNLEIKEEYIISDLATLPAGRIIEDLILKLHEELQQMLNTIKIVSNIPNLDQIIAKDLAQYPFLKRIECDALDPKQEGYRHEILQQLSLLAIRFTLESNTLSKGYYYSPQEVLNDLVDLQIWLNKNAQPEEKNSLNKDRIINFKKEIIDLNQTLLYQAQKLTEALKAEIENNIRIRELTERNNAFKQYSRQLVNQIKSTSNSLDDINGVLWVAGQSTDPDQIRNNITESIKSLDMNIENLSQALYKFSPKYIVDEAVQLQAE